MQNILLVEKKQNIEEVIIQYTVGINKSIIVLIINLPRKNKERKVWVLYDQTRGSYRPIYRNNK